MMDVLYWLVAALVTGAIIAAMFAIPILWYGLMLKLYQWHERRKRSTRFHRG